MKDAQLTEACDAISDGEPVVIPTDTVYGLAARPDLPRAVAALFAAKQRPPDKPVPVLAARVDDLEAVAVLDGRARALAARFWPGPLTLVLLRAPGCSFDLGRASGTVAVRIPRCTVALRLLSRCGPLAVTSANMSGAAPATTAGEARAALGDLVRVYLDDGPREGAASTVVSLVGAPRVLRRGALAPEEVLRS